MANDTGGPISGLRNITDRDPYTIISQEQQHRCSNLVSPLLSERSQRAALPEAVWEHHRPERSTMKKIFWIDRNYMDRFYPANLCGIEPEMKGPC
ncbi:hypothetical protein MSG28_011897 [Choristoneura fumiferana]|uniref:Uncharacterized protein n=1 Tax=Choristoneura fumiferana TaxID=7141 RepID=A0ACC0KNC1_CHOFU|nr:hypothetical protein MSG28_011897 [Choristoneura fumiferana]